MEPKSTSMPHYPLMIRGARPSGKVEVVAPFDLTPIATVDTAGADAVDVALSTAQNLYNDRSAWLPLLKRLQILENLQKLILDNAESLALEAAREGGKFFFILHPSAFILLGQRFVPVESIGFRLDIR